jgi:cellulose synthase/poly-beta-1,6-N-acetylglucosamine synthase-like glycosyltransferase
MKTSYCSVIVPTFDRPEAVEACVQALSHLDYPQDRLEIILVDDGSRVPVRVPQDREGVKIICGNTMPVPQRLATLGRNAHAEKSWPLPTMIALQSHSG